MSIQELLKDFKTNFPLIDKDLHLDIDYEDLEKEFFWFLDHEGKASAHCSHNMIVKMFQQDMFYIFEKELWKDDDMKARIIANRCKYLSKKPAELTTLDILSGFKRSGIYYGYSGFNPLLAKWFFSRYGVHICYDPCGGWGHRMLGATELDRYIYNDLSTTVCYNVSRIKECFDIYNTEIYNNDARYFTPADDYDAMFTCPPYFNLEHYECGDFANREEYDLFIDALFDKFISKDSCKVFGLVIREDLLGKHDDYAEKISINNKKADHLLQGFSKTHDEYLYIYKK